MKRVDGIGPRPTLRTERHFSDPAELPAYYRLEEYNFKRE